MHTQKHIKNHPVPKEEYLYHSANSCGCVFVACDRCVDINLLATLNICGPALSMDAGSLWCLVWWRLEACSNAFLCQYTGILGFLKFGVHGCHCRVILEQFLLLLGTTKGRQCHQGICFHAKTLDERHLSKCFPCE